MKQPILFQSRVIDLAEIESKLVNVASKYIYDISNAFTLFQFIDKSTYAEYMLLEHVMKEFGIYIPELKYKRLERPYALDKLTGEIRPVSNIEYTHAGKLDGVIVYTSDTGIGEVEFWTDSKSPEIRFASSKRRIADIEILHDGWFK